MAKWLTGKKDEGTSLLEDIGKALFEKKPEIEISKPIKECRNCTYYRPLEKFYGYCGKTNNNLAFNQAPLCPDYLAFGEVTVSALDAGVLTSGLLDLARIPRLDLTKIPLGTSGYFLKGQGASDSIYALLAAGDIPSLDASKIASGVFDLARIPIMDDAHIPDLQNLSGILGDAKLDLSALTQDMNITKATPMIKLQRTTGAPTIEFNDATHNFQVIMHVTSQELRILYDAGYIFQIDSTGKITFGSADASLLVSGLINQARIPWTSIPASGIVIGGDVNLYRSAANMLKTDDSLVVGGSAGIDVQANVMPVTTDLGSVGTQVRHWDSVWANYLKYDIECTSFEEHDDLAIIESFKERNGKYKMDFLRGQDKFFSIQDTIGFLIGCIRKLNTKVKALEQKLNERG